MTDQPDADPPLLEINQRTVEGIVVVEVSGEIDLETAPALDTALRAALRDAGAGGCIADLTDVSFLGSIGLTTLLNATQAAERRREPLRIVVDSNRPVIRPIETTGLDEVLRLFHTIDEALRFHRA